MRFLCVVMLRCSGLGSWMRGGGRAGISSLLERYGMYLFTILNLIGGRVLRARGFS